jgi:ABC-2 type transport system ATP-binding protein
MTAVLLDSVSKVFPRRGAWNLFNPPSPEVPALRGVSLRVEDGEIVGFKGRNGAGKTTLLKIVAGALYADGGTVQVLGHRLPESEDKIKGQVVYVGPEERSFYFRLTVLQNLKFFLSILPDPVEEKEVKRWVERFGAGAYLHRRFDSLSTGERQKVALARAFAMDAPLYLLDEPFRSLDDAGLARLGEVLREFVGRKTVLIASPQEHPLLAACTRTEALG